jgi:hypothetical protein
MRTIRLVAILLLASAPAYADVAGAYDVKFEEMSTNCDPVRFTYTRGTVKVATAKSSLTVNISISPTGAMIPQMNGVPAKSGKINAKTPKKQPTTIDGIEGKFGVSGRVDDTGVLQLVLVAEYTKQADGKPLCTQSWNVSGVRAGNETKPEPKPDKPKAKSVLDAFFPAFAD